ncbi:MULTISPECIES: BrnA antitoxin family protein [unclassified Roseitalea]|uniref:BrnA antitoxin family protein n=1 Tax=unclassified Roseitalea TaxID=2639107 RepID=UPI00273D2129|nr:MULTISPECIES: BrnA antitoxin family protein [unclassified Roseitalea]
MRNIRLRADRRTPESRAKARASLKSMTEAEAARLSEAAASDPDNPPLTEAEFARARPGRPPLPPERRKRRVTLSLDPDVLAELKKDGRGWQTRANAVLRKALFGK